MNEQTIIQAIINVLNEVEKRKDMEKLLKEEIKILRHCFRSEKDSQKKRIHVVH